MKRGSPFAPDGAMAGKSSFAEAMADKQGEKGKEAAEVGGSKERMMIVRGRDIETGLPRSLRISESEVREAITPILTQIIQSVADVLEETPPELLPENRLQA